MSERSGSLFRRCAAVAATLTVAGALAGCDPVSVLQLSGRSASSVSAPISAPALRLVDAINKFRGRHGLGPLTAYNNLDDKAVWWSAAMAGGNCPGGAQICHSDLSSGIEMPWGLLEENVGAASPAGDLGALELGFERSPVHAANMLDSRITSVGVGVAYSANTIFVAEEFLGP